MLFHNNRLSSLPTLLIVCTGLGGVKRGFETYANQLAELLHKSIDKSFDVKVVSGYKMEYTVYAHQNLWSISRNNRLLSLFTKNLHTQFHTEQISIFFHLALYILRLKPALVYLGEYRLYCYLFKFRKIVRGKWSLCLHTGGQAMPGLFDAKKDWVHHITDLFFKDCIQQGIPAEKQFLLPHFIRLPEQANATAIETIKKLALSKYIVLSVGSLDESVKGMNTLAKALSTIKNKVFPVFIGESTAQTPALEQQLRQNFGDDFLITKMEPHELTAYYNASDLFVSCSKAESFGLVMLEAMAQGTPVLCKNWPGSDWVFDKHAHYIKHNDSAVLGNQIEFLLESNCKKKSTAILKEYVSSRFSEDSLAKDYILMFERMVNP